MNIAYIMRGVPGSGKSTVARILAGKEGVVHCTDDYFYVEDEYVFDPSLLGKYHDQNFAAFCESLRKNVPIVICDNTNVKRWHFERYVEAATESGYMVAFVVMPHPSPEVAASRTIHKVPVHTIRRMVEGWEN